MRLISRAAAVLTLLATPGAAVAQSTGQCLTEPEATALFNYATPEVLDAVAKRCIPELPKTAFLSAQAPQLVAQYRAQGAASWPLAKAAFLKSMDSNDPGSKIVAGMADDAVRNLLTVALGTVLTGDIKVEECPQIDKLVGALSPLPVANLSMMIVQIMRLTGKDGSDFRICGA